MKKKIKLRDMTKEQFDEVTKDRCCEKNCCKMCVFNNIDCDALSERLWLNHKDLYSDKFLDQEVEIDVPDILTDKEKAYLSAVIKPWRDNVDTITKDEQQGIELIDIFTLTCDFVKLPPFKKDTMYKGMEADKEYNLEELGL